MPDMPQAPQERTIELQVSDDDLTAYARDYLLLSKAIEALGEAPTSTDTIYLCSTSGETMRLSYRLVMAGARHKLASLGSALEGTESGK